MQVGQFEEHMRVGMKLKFINSMMYAKPTLVFPSDLVPILDKETSSSQ